MTYRTHHLLGALIGTAIAPGVGTVIGGLEGTGSKADTSTDSSSYTYPVQDEITTKATITLEDLESKDVFPVEFDCNSDLNDTRKKLYNFKPKPIPVSSHPDSEKMDPFQQVEELKKLLDERIITQAEFDRKKKQLLDL